ncbi:response regulator transcription factor [Sansalvadorimonas verongulae]|uniref:response regulator transcription factor n=1 Tax=Sansalvadorimonas verongulae TaxID=2172824 RepID=UPI0012BD11F6|nr:response regulator transcription factor [Sansalvadorimonas verongulae]MTI14767.1 response regulator transcription factor [Sansalvadorimonas verongulae]
MRLLLIEDSRDIAGVVFDYFEALGHELDYAADGRQGLNLGTENLYDLILLDVMLPGMDGYSVCRTLREQGVKTPVLMLTARDTKDDTLTGFAHGADDYVVKPFDLNILEARIEALVRRSKPEGFQNDLSFGELSLNMESRIVTRNGQTLNLNPTGFRILKLLISKAPAAVSRDEIIYELWKDNPPDGDVLRNHIYQLRTQVDKPFPVAMVKTVPTVGYRLECGTQEP